MNEDTNKAIARRFWEEIMPARDEAALRDVVDENVTSRPPRPDERRGVQGVIDTMHWLASVFADQRWEIHSILADGDLVCVHATHHGRHVGHVDGHRADRSNGRLRLRPLPPLPGREGDRALERP